jgi:hypothetical protein
MNFFFKLGVLVALLISTLTGSAQSKSYRIFDEYANKEGFTYFAFSKAMIDAVNLKLDEENKKVTGDLNEIRFLLLDREKSNLGGTLSKSMASKLEKLEYRKAEPNGADANDDVEFWVDGDSKRINECHVIVRNSDDNQFTCLVSFYGNFKVEDLESLEKFSRKQSKK